MGVDFIEKLIYGSPARLWREALPLGNGFTGVMVYGGKRSEKLSFNDCTLWSGYPKDQSSAESLKYLDEVRHLVFEGKNAEADRFCAEKLCGAYSEGYLPLGDLLLSFSAQGGKGYSRVLDLGTAVHTVKFDGVRREMFCSNPDRVTVCRIESDHAFSLDITAQSKLHSEVLVDDALNLLGNAPDYVAPSYLRDEKHPVHYEKGRGMSFCLRCEAETDGKAFCGADSLSIKNARTITLFITTATGFVAFDKMPDIDRRVALQKCRQTLAAAGRDYSRLKARHIHDYQTIYEKQSVSLGERSGIGVSELIKEAKAGNVSPALCGLLYNYGKYLMIAGSRADGQALNLQGIWNRSVRPPWSSNYTTNINTEMNYWGMSRAGLTDCAEPYVRFVYNLMQNGRRTAAVNYGCEGFCCNHNADIWCKTTPVQGDPVYMYAPLCGAWLSNELYAHWKNGGLEACKAQIFAAVRESARFIDSYLVMHDGCYVTAPSASPEASFTRGGSRAGLDWASTFEMSIARQAFANYLEIEEKAVDPAQADRALAGRIKEKLPMLYPIKEGSTGILEWHDDVPITERGHRHFSPLYGLYPGDIIKFHANPEQTGWVKKLFDDRTAHATQYIGWSAAWAMCLCGRLHDGQKAKTVVDSLLTHAVFKNLFCVHPPFLFQIDGNMGFIAGVNELLVYEEDGVIDLLPALPESWREGEVKNMVVRGTRLSFKWEDGLVTEVESDRPVTVSGARLRGGLRAGQYVKIK